MKLGHTLIILVLLVLGTCNLLEDHEPLMLGFPVAGSTTVYNISHEPIGDLDMPWLFKRSQLIQPGILIPLSYQTLGDAYWEGPGYVEKGTVTIMPPAELNLAKQWTNVLLHPAHTGLEVEHLMIRDTGKKIELRVRIDLQSARYYRYSKTGLQNINPGLPGIQ